MIAGAHLPKRVDVTCHRIAAHLGDFIDLVYGLLDTIDGNYPSDLQINVALKYFAASNDSGSFTMAPCGPAINASN
jgi:hypothetical protein